MKTAVITGAETRVLVMLFSIKLSKLNYNLILCGRNIKKLEDLKNPLVKIQMLLYWFLM